MILILALLFFFEESFFNGVIKLLQKRASESSSILFTVLGLLMSFMIAATSAEFSGSSTSFRFRAFEEQGDGDWEVPEETGASSTELRLDIGGEMNGGSGDDVCDKDGWGAVAVTLLDDFKLKTQAREKMHTVATSSLLLLIEFQHLFFLNISDNSHATF